MDEFNPIISVGGVSVKCPSTYEWSLQDISNSDAGRTESTIMDKNRIGQCVKIQLAWQNITTEEASAILTAFNPEYLNITYLDPMVGGPRTSVFYVGDRSAPAYNTRMGLWSNVAFNIIERSGR